MEREEVFSLSEDSSAAVKEVVRQSANLGALAAIGGASAAMERGITLPAIADAESTMDESFERHGRGGTDGADFLQGHFSREDNLRESEVLEKAGLLRSADITLS